MTPARSLAAWIALAVLAVVALTLYGREQRARGRAEAALVTLRQTNDSLRLLQARVDTVFRIQRDTFVVRRIRLDTMTVTVEHWKHDTLRVVEYVTRADSTVRACSALVVTCEERTRLWAARYANLEAQLAHLPKPRPSWQVWAERLLVGGLAFTAGKAVGAAGR